MTHLQKIKERFEKFAFSLANKESRVSLGESGIRNKIADFWLKEINQLLKEKREEVEKLLGERLIYIQADKKLNTEFDIAINAVLAILTPPSEEKK